MPDTARINELGGTSEGARAVAAMVADPSHCLLALDFDGVLAPIVPDPDQAYALPAAIAALSRLGGVLPLAVVTGRPARTAVRLGGLDRVEGLERLVLLGQYGVERWDAETGEFSEPPDPEEVRQLAAELPEMLSGLGLPDVFIEDKGRAVAVHTRRAADPAAALAVIAEPLTRRATELGLHLEPGRNVLEVRSPGQDKGMALRALVAEKHARAVGYAGDDLGDIPAFEAVESLRREGIAGVTVASTSDEQQALAERADLVRRGPEGVADWLAGLAELLGR
ncbi:trehalose-phosphatase [Enemella evansiae]|uniref:trehalose-phosphatase n=1 Tax=Enemella evansiae TaxID=2016499 RepID=UPI000B96BFB0|nr:trehalose-phosphatase [Enemella evansiae]OYN93781.1 trehalose-phosphatase [Enemella evansiae]